MAFNTPPRNLPGAYLQTPAPAQNQQNVALTHMGDPFQRNPSIQLRGGGPAQPPGGGTGQEMQQVKDGVIGERNDTSDLRSRAGRAIDTIFRYEIDQPDLDAYVGQGVSNQYDTSNDAAWDPFQTVKMYPIPDIIYDQFNQAQVRTHMGLFAEIDQAWVAIDDGLYIWDYTNPSSATLEGVESQSSAISAVHLAIPRPGVFLPEIKYVLVLATMHEIILYGVSRTEGRGGTKSTAFHKTNMSVSVKGIDVYTITSSRTTGRIFFAGHLDNDVYELAYQPEEKWFYNRCYKTNHTSGLYLLLSVRPVLPSMNPLDLWKTQKLNHVQQMCVDDSRQLLYTLSLDSSIRVYHMKDGGVLELAITKDMSSISSDIGNRATRDIMSETLNSSTRLISISPIPSQEAAKLHLLATTNTGYRIYFSATTRHGWAVSDRSQAPRSLQVQHLKVPPRIQPSTAFTIAPNQGPADSNQPIRTLSESYLANRNPPGYFFCFTYNVATRGSEVLFISAVDSGQIARAPQAAQLGGSRFQENQMFLVLSGHAEAIGMRTPSYNASERPTGFGNESSLQFDKSSPEFAILTNAGVHVVRRRRHVDVFAAFARQGGSGVEGRPGLVRTFIHRYGRRETIATALAVACGQGVEVSSDFRSSKMTDTAVLDFARAVFINEGGKPGLNPNALNPQNENNAIDLVRTSPRHFGLVLYLSRIIRSIWSSVIAREILTPAGGIQVLPSVAVVKIQDIQRDLSSLREFLRKEKSSIDGLSGPEILSKLTTRNAEVEYQAEHREMQAVVQFIDSTIEGISFILVLFDERVEEIVALLLPESRQQFMSWTFRELFTQQRGTGLAKEVVRAIVNRNIAKGSNVETIAEALRRRCGSFCSADDVIVFKAQELLKRADEANNNAEASRNQLNESLRLFSQVAQSLTMETLASTLAVYVNLHFFAGAIELALAVAQQHDKANLALSWMNDGDAPRVDALGEPVINGAAAYADPRRLKFEFRRQCYDMIHRVIVGLDEIANQDPDSFSGRFSVMNRRRAEAYEVINTSTDQVFLMNLYDWYLGEGWQDRILEAGTTFVETYLTRRGLDDLAHADLLWQYYIQKNRFYEAAKTQYGIAQSSFRGLKLEKRIEYLGRAKANIQTRTPTGTGPRQWQDLKQRISDQLDIANVQDDIYQRLQEDARIPVENKQAVLEQVDSAILTIQELFTQYADLGSYYDICLVIFQISDTRDPMIIHNTWAHLITSAHETALESENGQPYEIVRQQVREVAHKVRMSDFVFPVQTVLALLERYKFEHQRGVGRPEWVVDLFLELGIAHEAIYSALEAMFYNDEAPFSGANRRVIGNDMVYLISQWYMDSGRGGGQIFGSDEVANAMSTALQMLQQNGLDQEFANQARELRVRIEGFLR